MPTAHNSSKHPYAPFGNKLLDVNSDSLPFSFLGNYGVLDLPEYSIHLTKNRAYSPNDGAFHSVDPLRLRGSVNHYGYSLNNPISLVDGDGNAAVLAVPIILILIGGGGVALDSYIDRGPMDGTGAGCGSGYTQFVPDRVGNTNLAWACHFHDLCYSTCSSDPSARQQCDASFYWNIRNSGGSETLARLYYGGVSKFGGSAFRDAQTAACAVQTPSSHDAPGGGGSGANAGDGNSDTAAAIDPNEKTAQAGYGPESFVAASRAVPYRVEFENYGPGSVEADGTPAPASRWATAPAQIVTVSDFLSTDLDWTTFQLTDVAFGDTVIKIQPTLSISKPRSR